MHVAANCWSSISPQGRISELRTVDPPWEKTLARYALKATFSNLGMRAGGYFPGANGLAGLIDLNEKAGELSLDAQKAVGTRLARQYFPSPNIDFDQLKARVTAGRLKRASLVDVKLERLQFDGADATGTASGSYRYERQWAGRTIDLGANVARADARAGLALLCRNADQCQNAARLGAARCCGRARRHDGKLVLKGNLADFPFRDPVKGASSWLRPRRLRARWTTSRDWPRHREASRPISASVSA
jgi:uncharacterized protein YhdP